MKISANQYQRQFMETDAAGEVMQQLQDMEADLGYSTRASYRPGYEDGISFSEKHFATISTNPNIKPREYMANLRLMTRIGR